MNLSLLLEAPYKGFKKGHPIFSVLVAYVRGTLRYEKYDIYDDVASHLSGRTLPSGKILEGCEKCNAAVQALREKYTST